MKAALAETAQVQDLQSQEEVLEVWVRQLEGEFCSGESEAETPSESPAEDAGEAEVIPHPQVLPIVHQKVKHEPPLGPRGVAACNPVVTEFTTYIPYTPTELLE